MIGAKATSIEHYAARELQRYLYQLSATLPEIAFATDNRRGPVFLLGRAETNPAIQRLVDAGQRTVFDKDPGPQGYVLKKFDADGRECWSLPGAMPSAACTASTGSWKTTMDWASIWAATSLPERSPLRIPNVDQRTRPAVAVRGFLPWTNFPQSATVYSWQDWRFIIDQMAKMRMNFLHIHNYNEDPG